MSWTGDELGGKRWGTRGHKQGQGTQRREEKEECWAAGGGLLGEQRIVEEKDLSEFILCREVNETCLDEMPTVGQ